MITIEFASIIGNFTPRDTSISPIQYTSETTSDEEEFLGEPQPAKERGRRFMSNDGQRSTVIQRYASNGKRDITLFDGPFADQLISWAQRNPTVFFDFMFQYKRNIEGTEDIRKHYHKDCYIENTPARAISNDIAVIKFTLNYAKLQLQDQDGNPL